MDLSWFTLCYVLCLVVILFRVKRGDDKGCDGFAATSAYHYFSEFPSSSEEDDQQTDRMALEACKKVLGEIAEYTRERAHEMAVYFASDESDKDWLEEKLKDLVDLGVTRERCEAYLKKYLSPLDEVGFLDAKTKQRGRAEIRDSGADGAENRPPGVEHQPIGSRAVDQPDGTVDESSKTVDQSAKAIDQSAKAIDQSAMAVDQSVQSKDRLNQAAQTETPVQGTNQSNPTVGRRNPAGRIIPTCPKASELLDMFAKRVPTRRLGDAAVRLGAVGAAGARYAAKYSEFRL